VNLGAFVPMWRKNKNAAKTPSHKETPRNSFEAFKICLKNLIKNNNVHKL
jgi:hypothetical protein